MPFEQKIITRDVVIFNRVLLAVLLLALPLILVCNQVNSSTPEDKLNALIHAGDIELIRKVPLHFDTHHVQGLDLSEQFYFVTSVDRKQMRSWLFRIDRANAGLNLKKELTDGDLIHPGGIQYDGRCLWIPNAEYRSESRTMIYAVDPDSLEIQRSFPVDDHIGAVASDGKNLIYGVNWDALHFYTWDFNGHQTSKVDSPTLMAYQDIKYFAGKLLCSGQKDGDSVIDVIDPDKWTLIKRIDLPRGNWKNSLSREGMTFDGYLYFLPDDGPDSNIMIFTIH